MAGSIKVSYRTPLPSCTVKVKLCPPTPYPQRVSPYIMLYTENPSKACSTVKSGVLPDLMLAIWMQGGYNHISLVHVHCSCILRLCTPTATWRDQSICRSLTNRLQLYGCTKTTTSSVHAQMQSTGDTACALYKHSQSTAGANHTL